MGENQKTFKGHNTKSLTLKVLLYLNECRDKGQTPKNMEVKRGHDNKTEVTIFT